MPDRSSDCSPGDSVPRLAVTGLFMTGLWIELQPHEVPSARNVRSAYHISLPTGGPLSSPEYKLSEVTLSSMSAKSYRLLRKTTRSLDASILIGVLLDWH